MTRQQLNQHWEVIDAWRKGVEVEYYNPPAKKWVIAKEPSWCPTIDYRVKLNPEYIPFDFTDAEFLTGKVVKAKNSNWVLMITACNNSHCYSDGICFLYEELLSNFTFLDGSPCGKLK